MIHSPHVQFKDVFAAIADDSLNDVLVERTFDTILNGAWTPVQIGGFLCALRVRGETPAFIAAAARAMRTNMIAVEHGFPKLLDTCGTGGDHSGSVNLSTGSAIVCAALGVPVAKHGNRAVSSRAGSADVIAALGIPTHLPAAAAARVLKEANIAFLLASTHHPAMRFATPVRKELGIRTIFNCLGPLVNPARATHQLIGAYSDAVRSTMAATLRELGVVRAWVVRGVDGIDEVSPYGPTRVTVLSDGALEERVVTPEDFGLRVSEAGAADGGTAEENASIIEAVLSGKHHPARNAFVLNAAAALVVVEDLPPKTAAEKAQAALDDGKALAVLHRWRDVANSNKEVAT